jgi:hypothetical protein
MGEAENLPMFSAEEMPVTDEPKKEKRPVTNNLQDNFIYLLNSRKIELVDVQRETMIAWGTLYAWYSGDAQRQMVDQNLKELVDYFDVDMYELCFGDMEKELEKQKRL